MCVDCVLVSSNNILSFCKTFRKFLNLVEPHLNCLHNFFCDVIILPFLTLTNSVPSINLLSLWLAFSSNHIHASKLEYTLLLFNIGFSNIFLCNEIQPSIMATTLQSLWIYYLGQALNHYTTCILPLQIYSTSQIATLDFFRAFLAF